MAKKESGSQLKRLKSALRDSGVSRDSSKSAKGPRKSKVDREKKLAKIRATFNPYESQINKAKFAVGGRKIKGTEGRPGAAASMAEQMRRDTLGAERQRKGRVGGVVDRRFGEGRADLTPDQIQLERFTRERQKSGKRRNNFSLEEDGDENGLTHLGQSLDLVDDFGPAPMSDDEDMGAEMVHRTNFGGFAEDQLQEDEIIGEDGEKRKKTKAEIMQEIIAKSKQGRSDRQRQAEEDDETREALDAELEDLQLLLNTTQEKRPTVSDGVSADRMAALQEDTEYDKAVKSLIYDRRAKASERTKTEEELIEEEAKRLHEQEEARIKRMRGEEVDEDEAPNKKKRKRIAQGDDLSDDFQSGSESEEEEFGIGVNAPLTSLSHESKQSASDNGSSVEDSSDEAASETGLDPELSSVYESDDGNDDNDDNDDDEDSAGDEDDVSEIDGELPSADLVAAAQAELDRRQHTMKEVRAPTGMLKNTVPAAVTVDTSELKFTYPCPGSLSELLAIISPLKAADVPTALHRIRVLHHPRLNPANNDKLSKYVVALIDYVLTDEISEHVADYCVTQIHDLSQKYWEPSATHFLEILEDIRQIMYKDLTKCWTLKELKFFSLIGQIWSTSDAYHKIVTPSLLVLSQYLSQSSDHSLPGKGLKLILCSIIAHYFRDSKRYMPEVMQVLFVVLQSTSATDPDLSEKINVHTLSNVSEDTLHKTAERLVRHLAVLYLSSPAFVEIFEPFVPYLTIPMVKEGITKSLSNAKQVRRPLSLQSHRPIPLASYVPKFEENFSLDKKSYDRNTDRAADSKLKSEIRDARRGAVRVLRRDAAFEARQGAQERRSKGAVYADKMKKVENRIRQKDS